MKETDQIKFWKKVGESYTDANDDWDTNTQSFTISHANSYILKDLGSIDRDAKILEVGCNVGRNLHVLHQDGFKNLYGIDIQSYAVEKLKERVPNVNAQVSSALELPFEDDFFDVVYTAGVLIHISPNDIARVVEEICRCVKPGGYIWGCELYHDSSVAIPWRNNNEACWADNFPLIYSDSNNNLELLKEDKIPLPRGKNNRQQHIYLFKKGHHE